MELQQSKARKADDGTNELENSMELITVPPTSSYIQQQQSTFSAPLWRKLPKNSFRGL